MVDQSGRAARMEASQSKMAMTMADVNRRVDKATCKGLLEHHSLRRAAVSWRWPV